MSGSSDSCNQDFNQSVEPETESTSNNDKTLVEEEQPTLDYDMDGAIGEEVKRGSAYNDYANEWMQNRVEPQVEATKTPRQAFDAATTVQENQNSQIETNIDARGDFNQSSIESDRQEELLEIFAERQEEIENNMDMSEEQRAQELYELEHEYYSEIGQEVGNSQQYDGERER